MVEALPYFLFIPVLAFFLEILIPRNRERLLSGFAIGFSALFLLSLSVAAIRWIQAGSPLLSGRYLTLYESPAFEFFIAGQFDRNTLLFAWIGALLCFCVALFSRFYMHRDEGFKRFFSTLMLFFAGYNLVVFSGNFETMFLGWEILGITSFLLIGFYRDRYLPVRNAYKVLSFYRVSDIALMLAMWMTHHLWRRNIQFSDWLNAVEMQQIFTSQAGAAGFIVAMIILAALIKSALFPFSTWLPRAMEGPTSSSAIFYGALSVHIGAFLLLRTAPLWEPLPWAQTTIIVFGLFSVGAATISARVQNGVKVQIAYASIAQIGIIFIEIALGLHGLALLHFAGNACLRMYQLLVSPSVLSYEIHNMLLHFQPGKRVAPASKWQQAAYLLGLKEWNLDHLLRQYLWRPFKATGAKLSFFSKGKTLLFLALLLISGTGFHLLQKSGTSTLNPMLAHGYALLALLLCLRAFSERGNARFAWIMSVMSLGSVVLSIAFLQDFTLKDGIYLLLGGGLAAFIGDWALTRTYAIDEALDLDQYHGYAYETPAIAFVFLIACLMLAGFPLSPGFIGVDLLFTKIGTEHPLLLLLVAMNFLFLELALLRIYCRVFLGQHKKGGHPIAFKSS